MVCDGCDGSEGGGGCDGCDDIIDLTALCRCTIVVVVIGRGLFSFFLTVMIIFASSMSFAQGARRAAPVVQDYPKFTLDLGVSVGSYSGVSYTEANLGLNTYFADWFIFRNAAFGRFASGLDDVYGLDSSARFVGRLGEGSRVGLTAFAGPGYRMVNRGDNAPFAEAGTLLRLGGFSIGGGAKVLFYNSSLEGRPASDTIYFLILAGGATL